MPSVAGSGRQVSCLSTLSLEAGDEWDCHSQGQLAARCHLSLLFRPPGASTVWLSRQQRRANVLLQRRAVECNPLSYFHARPVNMARCQVTKKSKPLLSRCRTKPRRTSGLEKCRRTSRRTGCGPGCSASPWWRDRTCPSTARATFMSASASAIRNTKARLGNC